MRDGYGMRILVGVLALIAIAGGVLWTAAIREGRRSP